jgi:hypothetical protein
MSRHLVVVSINNGGLDVTRDPLPVVNDDDIRWTSRDGDIRVELPPDLAGRPASEPPEIREARRERLTSPVVVKANPALRDNQAWYEYKLILTTSSGGILTRLPHVIVTSP